MIRQVKLSDKKEFFIIYYPLLLDRKKLKNQQEYKTRVQKEGFLLGGTTKNNFFKLLNKYFLTYEEKSKLFGFINVEKINSSTHIKRIEWINEKIKRTFVKDNQFCLDILMVRKDFFKKGIAVKLLQRLEKILKENGFQYLFSWVVINPVTNLASLYFHEGNKFLRAGVYSNKKEFDLKNYKSILYYKKL